MTRAFTAIFPPAPVREKLARFVASLEREGGDVKWVRPENLHLTLRFFGDLEDDALERAQQVTREIVSSFAPFRVRLAGTGTFPARGRPRVYWVGIDRGVDDLDLLAGALDRGYRSAGLGKADKAFAPHLTVGRARPPRGRRQPVPQKLWTFGRLTFESLEFTVPSVCVVASELSPRGPTYEPLAEFPMSGHG